MLVKEKVRDITKFEPIICGLHHERTQSAIIECSFWGQWSILPGIGKYDLSQIILTGNRYLLINKLVLKANWVADKVHDYIKDTEGKIFFVKPTPYLNASLKPLNRAYSIPPTFFGEVGVFSQPKVKYTEIIRYREEGNRTSELEDLIVITNELIASKKIVISQFSNFDIEEENQKYSLVLVVKEMLGYLLGGDVTLRQF